MKVKILKKLILTTFSKIPISGERISLICPMIVDGEGLVGIDDFRIDRINVEISIIK